MQLQRVGEEDLDGATEGHLADAPVQLVAVDVVREDEQRPFDPARARQRLEQLLQVRKPVVHLRVDDHNKSSKERPATTPTNVSSSSGFQS